MKAPSLALRFSVVIPCSEMGGKGADFLHRSLKMLDRQTFSDFEVVLTDDSPTDALTRVCKQFPRLKIKYLRNPVKGMAANTNYGLAHADGELIKILYQDDFLRHEDALRDIDDRWFSTHWMVTGCEHTTDGETFTDPHYPSYHPKIHTGLNTIGSPSVLTILNRGHLTFDEPLTWLLDCDYYRRCYDKWGPPTILNSLNVAIGLGPHQVSNLLTEGEKQAEHEYLLTKFK